MRWDMGRLQRLARPKIWWAGELGRQCPMHSRVSHSVSKPITEALLPEA